jgi:hypothetical protein
MSTYSGKAQTHPTGEEQIKEWITYIRCLRISDQPGQFFSVHQAVECPQRLEQQVQHLPHQRHHKEE